MTSNVPEREQAVREAEQFGTYLGGHILRWTVTRPARNHLDKQLFACNRRSFVVPVRPFTGLLMRHLCARSAACECVSFGPTLEERE